MATYPGAIPSLVRPAAANRANDGSSTDATVVVGRISDEVEAIAGELGINPRGASATVKARLDAIEANGWVTSARILDGTIATGDLADGAITPIKLSGGYTAKTATYTATQDDRVIHVTSGTATINLPAAASSAGRVYTIADLGTGTVTIDPAGAELIGGATTLVLTGYGQATIVCTGTAWIILDAFYWDETVGRRLFRWNHALTGGTGGWQLVYGDTGWRNVTSDPMWAASDAAGGTITPVSACYLRRFGQTVHASLQFTLANTVNTGSNLTLATLPSGFRAFSGIETYYGSFNSGGTFSGRLNINSSGVFGGRIALTAGTTAFYNFAYLTTDPWPASLPGSASGSIPTG